MKIFERNKNKIKPAWIFNQKGNLWKFIFGGNDFIVGETRDIDKKLLYLFTIDINSGKKLLTDFLFEEGNYWVSIEGASPKIIYLNRFENPELPYHKNIIAIDIFNGNKIWENEEYQFFFSTEDNIFGIKQKFDKPEIVEINNLNGSVLKVFKEDEYVSLLDLKRKSDKDLYSEFYDYPKSINQFPVDNHLKEILQKETVDSNGDIEYIIKNDNLFFNYYRYSSTDTKDISRKYYKNTFCVFNTKTGEKIYQDTLNEKSGFNVPDNFFSKDKHVYYLREKKDLVALKIQCYDNLF